MDLNGIIEFMKMLYLLQGIPGSGKSTLAKIIDRDAIQKNLVSGVFSTDDFWYLEDGKTYKFNHDRLAEAHKWNQKRVALAMAEGYNVVIVDNTNIKRRDIYQYLVVSEMFGYVSQVVRVDPGITTCIERQQARPIDRQIPESVIRRMYNEMETLIPSDQ